MVKIENLKDNERGLERSKLGNLAKVIQETFPKSEPLTLINYIACFPGSFSKGCFHVNIKKPEIFVNRFSQEKYALKLAKVYEKEGLQNFYDNISPNEEITLKRNYK